MRKTHLATCFAALLCSGLAHAEGDLAPLERSEGSGVRVQARAPRPASVRGFIGFHAVERTRQIESQPLASAEPAAASTAPHFSRNDGDILRGAGWTVELDATLRRAAWAGNAVFVFYDVGDRKGNDPSQGYTALYQSAVPKGTQLAAHATLTLEEGFQPGHTYRLRIAQLISGKEVVLAESDFVLE